MPKRKTRQRKKHEAQMESLKERARNFKNCDLASKPCNLLMKCLHCKATQRIRAFCYYCNTMPNTPACGHCGKQKCVGQGECTVSHGSASVSGLKFVGAICCYCDTWICHDHTCLNSHPCSCPLKRAICVECNRSIYEHGGRVFRCAFCDQALCEDDQMEHQASCQTIDSENFKCVSCNRIGQLSCMRCKVCFCDTHVKRKGFAYDPNGPIACPRCGNATQQISALSVTAKTVSFGRGTRNSDNSESTSPEYESEDAD